MRPEAMLDLKARLGREEGVEYKSYLDSKGFPTGGEGHLLNAAERAQYPIGTPIPAEVVNDWFAQDFATANSSLAQMLRAHYKFDLYALPDTVQEALVDLTFNMGATRLCGFGNTLRLIFSKQWAAAADHLLQNADWVKTVKPARAAAIADLIRRAA